MSAKHDSNPTQGSPRTLLPRAVVAALTALIDDEGLDASERRAGLRTLRGQLCRLYRLPDPMSRLSDVQAEHAVKELDDEAIEDSI